MKTDEERYIEFASRISFFEFTQEEFENAAFPVNGFAKELAELDSRRDWDIISLTDFIQANPSSFKIFENIFQLRRFTDAQLIHFVFDIATLNSPYINAVFEYAFLNLKYDPAFQSLFLKKYARGTSLADYIKEVNSRVPDYLVAHFKSAISDYIKAIANRSDILIERAKRKEFADFAVRVSNYLLNNLELNSVLNSINLNPYLTTKRIPLDTKSIHGNYAKLRAIRILDEARYVNIDAQLAELGIATLPPDIKNVIPKTLRDRLIYCTEKYVEGINKTVGGKPKKFDFAIIGEKKTYLFEINFYTTPGTNIGINEGEYVDIYRKIKPMRGLAFQWITDGNYWLTTSGRTRFLNLVKEFESIYNLNTFAENVPYFK